MSILPGSIYCLISRLSPKRLLSCQIRHFPRGRRMLPLGGIDEMPDPVDRAYGAETEHSGLRDMDGFESMEDWFNEQSKDDNFIRTIERDHQKHQKFVAYKTMQRKYFRPPVEDNLLTWDAKEQIRYLNKEYPEEWTVDRLAESFPCSRDGIVRVLKSRYRPQSLKELQKHDRRVRTRWLALKNGDDSQGQGPITLRYDQLLTNGKMDLMLNAAGIKNLPKPKIHIPQLTSNTGSVKKTGLFESIVKDYVEKKTHKSADKTLAKKDPSVDDQELLQSIVESKKQKLINDRKGNQSVISRQKKRTSDINMKTDNSDIPQLGQVDDESVKHNKRSFKRQTLNALQSLDDVHLSEVYDEDMGNSVDMHADERSIEGYHYRTKHAKKSDIVRNRRKLISTLKPSYEDQDIRHYDSENDTLALQMEGTKIIKRKNFRNESDENS